MTANRRAIKEAIRIEEELFHYPVVHFNFHLEQIARE